MTLEQMIADINGKGLRVHNCFQLEMAKWRANLTDDKKSFYEFGHGATALDALREALRLALTHEENLKGLEGDLARLKEPTVQPTPSVQSAGDMFS